MNAVKGSWFFPVCILLYIAVVLSVIMVLRIRRNSRWPFQKDDKLLRGPGEELRRKLGQFEESFMLEFFAGIIVGPLMLACSVEYGPKWLGLSPAQALGWGVAGLIAVFGFSAWRVAKLWQQRQNHYLGWFGERYVAEWLEPAKLQGWRVFHDVPFTVSGDRFNLDHVVVGAGGVFVIETKTRRKGNARPGRKDSQVFFGGRELDWPWGTDSHGLEQAERNSVHLTKWIQAETNERVHVTPLLTLPGWWLENKAGKDARLCQVVNPKWLPGFFERQKSILSAKQIEFISAKLESRCRDVEE